MGRRSNRTVVASINSVSSPIKWPTARNTRIAGDLVARPDVQIENSLHILNPIPPRLERLDLLPCFFPILLLARRFRLFRSDQSKRNLTFKTACFFERSHRDELVRASWRPALLRFWQTVQPGSPLKYRITVFTNHSRLGIRGLSPVVNVLQMRLSSAGNDPLMIIWSSFDEEIPPSSERTSREFRQLSGRISLSHTGYFICNSPGQLV